MGTSHKAGGRAIPTGAAYWSRDSAGTWVSSSGMFLLFGASLIARALPVCVVLCGSSVHKPIIIFDEFVRLLTKLLHAIVAYAERVGVERLDASHKVAASEAETGITRAFGT